MAKASEPLYITIETHSRRSKEEQPAAKQPGSQVETVLQVFVGAGEPQPHEKRNEQKEDERCGGKDGDLRHEGGDAVFHHFAGQAQIGERREQRRHDRQADGHPGHPPIAEEEVVGVVLVARGAIDNAQRHQDVQHDDDEVEAFQAG